MPRLLCAIEIAFVFIIRCTPRRHLIEYLTAVTLEFGDSSRTGSNTIQEVSPLGFSIQITLCNAAYLSEIRFTLLNASRREDATVRILVIG